MQVYKNTKYYDVLLSEDKKIIEIKWNKLILELLEDDYKKVLLEAYTHLFEFIPDSLLQNTKEGVYPLTPSLQDWLTENITKDIFQKVGVKKIAYLVPSDVLTKMGIEMLVDKAMQRSSDIQRRFFDDYQQAIDWLKS